jgi:outer membrane receptor protein involved in Fe transport
LTIGGRWFDIDTDRRLTQGTLGRGVSHFRQMGIPLDCAVDLCYQDSFASSSESDFVPKLNLAYNFDDDKMVYATYSEGFRRGGGNAARQRSIFGRPPFNTFDSDLVKNYEVGAKTLSADGSFRFNITAYRMVWEDIQIEAEDPTPNLFTLGIINFPEAEIIGVEAFADWVPAPNWKFGANVGYNDAELSEDSAISIEGVETERSATAGTPLPLVPEWKFSLSVRHELRKEIFGAKASIGLSHQYNGESVSSLAGIQSIEFNNPVRLQKAYSLTDLRFSLDGGDWSATLYLDNAFNKYARQFHNDRWAQTRVSVNQPRTFGVNFRKYFN